MDYVVLVGLFLVGACLGSFVGAQVWRLRARQLREDTASGETVDKAEYKRLKRLLPKKGRRDRSIDLDTGKQLPWYDMIPVASWLLLKGRSRFTGKPIGTTEFLLEVGLGGLFVLSYLVWPLPLETTLDMVRFGLWLVASVLLAILFVYDLRWFILPNRIMWPLIGVAVLFSAITVYQAPELWVAFASLAGSILILSGLYFVLWLISKGSWIGFGDVKLGLALALFLVDWQLAFLALFLANFIGCLAVLPGMIRGTVSRTARIPFGPLLIVGMVLAFWWGERVIVALFI